MKKAILPLALIVCSCTSIKQQNAHLNDLIPIEKLQSDVDFTHKKLQKLQPKLYWYITKEQLDFKFDSLKKTITKPLTSFEFYKKISAVICAVRQGHLYLFPKTKQLTKAETKTLTKKGVGPFSQFDFEVFNDKLYIVKNKSYNKSIKVGTEVISINNLSTNDLLNEYTNYFTSDGFNTTFKRNRLGRSFSNFFTNANGTLDSLNYEFKHNDTVQKLVIKRQIVDSSKLKSKKVIVSKTQKKLKRKKNNLLGYDESTKLYKRNLHFLEKDSSMAVIKINGFKNGDYKACYKEFFEKIKQNKAKTLVLDLRNNGGGRLNEIVDLYHYLADSTFVFVTKSEIASKTSLLQADYFKGSNLLTFPIKLFFAPMYYSYTFLKARKYPDGKYYYLNNTKPKKIDKNAFKGKIYVLINGGSFSASSIISSNLKGSKRAIFVGEETGGAYNGTVAGRMPLVKMPHSKIKIRVGLMACIPFHKTDTEGRGIFPDQTIIPTLQDRINDFDPEMNWIFEDWKK
jgi:C-terminal processing protease CtpA/Prc